MESIVANLTGKVRRVTEGGREYIVAPMTTIVPGVLNGSKGSLFYPEQEIRASVQNWDEVPIVVYHPQTPDGSHVSAQHPGILDRQGIGFLRNSKWKGKLVHEGWFDVARTRAVDPRVLDALTNSRPMELSTGLFTDNEVAASGAHHRGRAYDFVARNYRADHLAILPDQVGACSLRDGCGVLVNRQTTNASHMQMVKERQAAEAAKQGGPASSPPGKGEMHRDEKGRFATSDHVVEAVKGTAKGGLSDLADVREHPALKGKQGVDEAITEARRSGKVTGQNYEGREGVTPRQQAAIHKAYEGDRTGYLALNRSAFMNANSNPEGINQYSGSHGISSAYEGAAKLSDAEHSQAHAAVDKASKSELQEALTKMGFRHSPSDSREKLADQAKQFISARRSSAARVRAGGKGHPLFNRATTDMPSPTDKATFWHKLGQMLGVTSNANPEGHNQYIGGGSVGGGLRGSEKANDASAKAAEVAEGDHKAAYKAHRKAADAHFDAADSIGTLATKAASRPGDAAAAEFFTSRLAISHAHQAAEAHHRFEMDRHKVAAKGEPVKNLLLNRLGQMLGITSNDQGRHQETGQFLPQGGKGTSKQAHAAAVKGRGTGGPQQDGDKGSGFEDAGGTDAKKDKFDREEEVKKRLGIGTSPTPLMENANPEGHNQYSGSGGGEHHPAAVAAVKKLIHDVTQGGKVDRKLTPGQMENQGANEYIQASDLGSSLRSAFPKKEGGHKAAGKAIRAAFEAGAHLTENARKCPECGEDMEDCECEDHAMNSEHCPRCGGEMDEDGECEDCGYTENASDPPSLKKSSKEAGAKLVGKQNPRGDDGRGLATVTAEPDDGDGDLDWPVETMPDDHQNPKSGPEELKEAATKAGIKVTKNKLADHILTNRELRSLGVEPEFATNANRCSAFFLMRLVSNEGFESDDQRQAFFGLMKAHGAVAKAEEKHESVKMDSKSTAAHELSAHAADRSAKAKKAGGAERRAKENEKAGWAHHAAAEAHKEAGNHEIEAHHRSASKEHYKAAVATQNRGGTMNRKAILARLTHNCRRPEDVAAFNSLSNEALMTIVRNDGGPASADGAKSKNGSMQVGGEEDSDGGDTADDYESEDEFTGKASTKAKGMPPGMNMRTWLGQAPPQARSIWNNAVKVHNARKNELIGRLVANTADNLRQRAIAVLNRKELEELELLASMIPTGNSYGIANNVDDGWMIDNQEAAPMFLGAGAPTANCSGDVVANGESEALMPPTINYTELVQEQREQERRRRA